MTFKALFFSATLPFVWSANAFAIHLYASYDCKAGALELKYDGPGSNYAYGGYSHFYVNGDEAGVLSYETSEGDSERVGEEIGGSGPLHVLFTVVKNEDVTARKTEPGGDECGAYDHSEWKSVRTIKIEDLSPAAAAKLGLKAGSVIKMSCDETEDSPSGDCSK